MDRYKINEFLSDDNEMMQVIGKKRGFIMRGGVVDMERLSKALLDDFTKQKFGKIMLEKANEY